MDNGSGRIHVMHVVLHGVAAGGMENGVINVANRLPEDRYRVSICALDTRQTFSERIRRADSEFYLVPRRGRGVDWGLVFRLARQFRSAQADLVHSHNWATFLYAVLAAKLAGLPVIHGEHGKNSWELDENNPPKLLAKRWLGRRVNRLVTVSQVIASEWAGYGVPAGMIQWIPNGVDIERFRPRDDQREQRRHFGLPEEGCIIGSVGRMDALKNYEVLVEAFARLEKDCRGCHLALLGDGQCLERVRKKAEVLGVAGRVSLLGRRPDPENFLAALDIFALPSKTEGMSNVVLEAMAAGLAIVCADLPCHHEVFEAGREALVVSPCTAENLGNVLGELCHDPARARALGTAARSKAVSRFDISRMVADYERLYREVSRPGAPGMTAATALRS